jgi:tetratricopeptide (TPR) repeat protein
MKRPALNLVRLLLALTLCWPGLALGQGNDDITGMLVRSYDLLEAGKVDQAQKIFEEILQKHPGEPLALNNLAAVMVKKGKYRQALDYLEEALPRAKGYKVQVNRVCDVKGVCLAFRPLAVEYGNHDLEALIRLNIEMIKAKLGLRRVS